MQHRKNMSSKNLPRYIIDTVPNPIFEVDEDLFITLVNREAHKQWPSIIEGQTFSYETLFSSEEKPEDCIVEKTLKMKIPQSCLIEKNGEFFNIKTNYVEDEDSARVVVHILDITELTQAKKALQEKTVYLDSMLRSSTHMAIATTDLDFRIQYYNPMAEELFGYKADEVKGRTVMEMHTREKVDPARFEKAIDIVKREGVYRYNFEQKIEDGIRYIDSSVSGIWDENEKLVGFVLMSHDVTESKQSRMLQDAVYRISEAVDSSENLDELYLVVHTAIQDVMPAKNFYIALYDAKEDLLSFPYYIDKMDLPPVPYKPGKGLTEYVLRTGNSLLCPEDAQKDLEKSGEIEIVGSPCPIWLGVPLKVEDKTIGVMAVQHYSDAAAYGERELNMLEYVSAQVAKAIDRKRTVETLEGERQRLFSIFDGIDEVMYISDPDTKEILFINQAMIKVFGNVVGQKCYQAIHGLTEPCSFCINQYILGDNIGKTYIREEQNKRNNRWYRCFTKAINWPDGRLVSHEMAIDITEKKKLEEQFLQAQKMEAVGILAGGISHDFNNLLTAIVGHCDLAMMSLNPADPIYQDLEQIHNSGIRAADLTKQLLAFSRKQTLEPRILDLNAIIVNIDRMLRRIIGEDINLITKLAPDLLKVKADPGQLEQVIINLAVNSRDAMPKGGTLTIETENVELEEEYVRTHVEVESGSYVMLAISDSGCGISKEIQTKIFEPFFTTKERGKGTGLGLSTVYGIIKQSGGNIWVYSEPGKGTSFKIYLPVVEGEAEWTTFEPETAKIPVGNETILVVEDDESLRNLVVRMLKQQGYKVIEAESGVEAHYMCRKMEKQIDLVITDVIMPTMGGVELAELLRELWPEVRVLYMSGYTPNIIVHQGVLDPGTFFLQKPFNPITIAQKVREVLDKDPG